MTDEKVWNAIGGNEEEILSTEKFVGHKTEVKEKIRRHKGEASANKKGKILGIRKRFTRGQREEIGMKTRVHGPVHHAKTLKLRNRVEDLDLPERRKRYASSREEDVGIAQKYPCG